MESVDTPLPLVDAHVHLEQFPLHEVAEILQRAAAAGVSRVLSVSVSASSSRRTTRLAARFPGVIAAVGVHPRRLHPGDGDAALVAMEHLLLAGQARAVGEVGLDYRGPAPARTQHAFLAACLRLALRFQVPLTLHVVGRPEQGDAVALLSEHAPVRAIVHYFVGDSNEAAPYLRLGCVISVGKPVTLPEHGAVRGLIADLPLGQLLLETDSYPLPGRTTEPCDVVQVCAAVAQLKGVSPATIAKATSATFDGLFGPKGAEPTVPAGRR